MEQYVPATLSKIGLVIASIPLVAMLFLFASFPETIPTHFSGSIVTWSDKWSATGVIASFLLPVLSLIICGLLYYWLPSMYRMAKEMNTAPKNPKNMELLVPSIAIIFLITQIYIIALTLANI